MTGDRKAPSLFVREPQLVEKVCFFKKSACSQSLSPNPFPRERGYITGATAPRPCRGLRPCDPIYIIKRFIDRLNLADLSARFCGGNVQKRFRSDNNSVKAARIKKIVYDIFKIEKLVPYPVIINV